LHKLEENPAIVICFGIADDESKGFLLSMAKKITDVFYLMRRKANKFNE